MPGHRSRQISRQIIAEPGRDSDAVTADASVWQACTYSVRQPRGIYRNSGNEVAVAARPERSPAYIKPGGPWQNGFVESFNGKLRHEYLNREWFLTFREAKIVIESGVAL
jgi:transposase InsO family protein